jgi:tetratricopeptide (TPR) repeat protein
VTDLPTSRQEWVDRIGTVVKETGNDHVDGADQIAITGASDQAALLAEAIDSLNAGEPAKALARFETIIAAADFDEAKRNVLCAQDQEQALLLSVIAAGIPQLAGKPLEITDGTLCAALFGKGYVLIDLGRADEALLFLERAAALAPLEAHYLNELGEWYKSQRDWQQSKAIFERAKALADGDLVDVEPEIEARSMRGIGYSLIELGLLDEARNMFEGSLELTPDNQTALSELAYIDSLEK